MASPAKSAFNFSGIGGQLRDPLSVAAPEADGTFATAFVSEFQKTLAKAKAAQGKAKDAYMKMFSNKYDIPWNIDLTQGIKEDEDKIKEDYLNAGAKYKWKIPPEVEVDFQNRYNDLVNEIGESKQHRIDYAGQLGKLLADKNETAYDHSLSSENLEIQENPSKWLENNKSNPRYKDVKKDWDEIEAEDKDATTYKKHNDFLALFGQNYSIVPKEKPFDFNVIRKATTVNPQDYTDTDQRGNILWSTKKSMASYQNAMMQGLVNYENMYDEDTKKKADDEFSKKKDKSLMIPVPDASDPNNPNKVTYKKKEFDNAKEYYANAAAVDAFAKAKSAYDVTAKGLPETAGQKRTENTLVLPPSKPETTTYVKDDDSNGYLPTVGGNAFGDAPTNKSFSGAIEYSNGSFKEDAGQAIKGDLTKIGIIDFGGKLGKQPVAFIAKEGKRNEITYVPLKGSAIDDVIEYMADKNILLDNSDDNMYKQYLGYSINDYVKKKQGDSGSEQQTKTTGTVR